MAGILFEDIFDVKDIDPEGKKFDRVSRLHCESESFKMDLILDVNIQIYPVDLGLTSLSMSCMGKCTGSKGMRPPLKQPHASLRTCPMGACS
ncbi:DNA-directed RNA polymerases I, II, and III subunit RPABC3 isoform 3 [Mus musculus]|uniref:Polymerase (RNA) II (DNA directed) polypeptide H n=1 Tax=Mus musculus TaxID=10090 RepID=A0A338P6M3_MOUSE|nr:DNA-directed RNA polymerases I, II, and III subunit RPABC3 isoform 3 [Mus musculus]EDK97592.1 polymerase (RNA) II (DNA directed) polypeptide H, isoform CRA_b [Mus musculus]